MFQYYISHEWNIKIATNNRNNKFASGKHYYYKVYGWDENLLLFFQSIMNIYDL